eukprot:TRINITY_DN9187_c0_g1_i1.p1 TRINITY_DN9187_c0_g1~~TRINITY_DN9187_c0_g1_i1.p1  ORF type:complete len:256 (+),score=50.26 TRINITY_DN9187_c0_g1_i1:226-993(+)
MAHHDWQEGNLQDDSDDEDYLYEGTPTSNDGLLRAERRDSWRDQGKAKVGVEATEVRGEAKKEKTVKKQEKFWRDVSKALGCMLAVSIVALILWCVYAQYYQECQLFLEEVQVTRLPERRYYISESVDLNFTLDISNPNRADAHLEFAYLRLAIIDEDKAISYDVHEPVRLPNNESILLPAATKMKYTFSTSVKIALLSEGLRVVMLLNNGCFTITVDGELSYRVSTFPHTSQVNRRQQLFGPNSCPFCGQQQLT